MSLLGGRLGTVDKAAFLIGKKQGSDGKWEFEKPVSVMLNPASIKVTTTTPVKRDEGVANEKTSDSANTDGKITPKGITEQQIEMVLIFNIVEEYNAKTEGAEFKALATAAKGVIGSLINGGSFGDTAEDALSDLIKKTDFTGLSLFNKDLCCYEPLMTAAHKQRPVVFFWGNITLTGIITKFQTTFNYFSSQGAPLGAEVSLAMVGTVDESEDKLSASSKQLIGLVSEAGRLIRALPGTD